MAKAKKKVVKKKSVKKPTAKKSKVVKTRVAKKKNTKKTSATIKKSNANKISYEQLVVMSNQDLEKIMRYGHLLKAEDIAGFEYTGLNVGVPIFFKKLFEKFKKVFYFDIDTGRFRGWNLKAVQNGASNPWVTAAREPGKTAFGLLGHFIYWLSGIRSGNPAHGFFSVYSARIDKKFNVIPQALLVNYAEGQNGFFNITSRLKDYLVAVNEGDTELILGQGYADFKIFSSKGKGFFILKKDGPISKVYQQPK